LEEPGTANVDPKSRRQRQTQKREGKLKTTPKTLNINPIAAGSEKVKIDRAPRRRGNHTGVSGGGAATIGGGKREKNKVRTSR